MQISEVQPSLKTIHHKGRWPTLSFRNLDSPSKVGTPSFAFSSFSSEGWVTPKFDAHVPPRVQCIIIYALSLVPNRLATATGRASGAHRRAEGSASAPRRALARRAPGRSPAQAGGPAALPGRRRPAPHRHRPPSPAAAPPATSPASRSSDVWATRAHR